MNRLDEIERHVGIAQNWAYISAQMNLRDVRQLVAVARAAAADNGSTASARRIREALAPLLAEKEE